MKQPMKEFLKRKIEKINQKRKIKITNKNNKNKKLLKKIILWKIKRF